MGSATVDQILNTILLIAFANYDVPFFDYEDYVVCTLMSTGTCTVRVALSSVYTSAPLN